MDHSRILVVDDTVPGRQLLRYAQTRRWTVELAPREELADLSSLRENVARRLNDTGPDRVTALGINAHLRVAGDGVVHSRRSRQRGVELLRELSTTTIVAIPVVLWSFEPEAELRTAHPWLRSSGLNLTCLQLPLRLAELWQAFESAISGVSAANVRKLPDEVQDLLAAVAGMVHEVDSPLEKALDELRRGQTEPMAALLRAPAWRGLLRATRRLDWAVLAMDSVVRPVGSVRSRLAGLASFRIWNRCHVKGHRGPSANRCAEAAEFYRNVWRDDVVAQIERADRTPDLARASQPASFDPGYRRSSRDFSAHLVFLQGLVKGLASLPEGLLLYRRLLSCVAKEADSARRHASVAELRDLLAWSTHLALCRSRVWGPGDASRYDALQRRVERAKEAVLKWMVGRRSLETLCNKLGGWHHAWSNCITVTSNYQAAYRECRGALLRAEEQGGLPDNLKGLRRLLERTPHLKAQGAVRELHAKLSRPTEASPTEATAPAEAGSRTKAPQTRSQSNCPVDEIVLVTASYVPAGRIEDVLREEIADFGRIEIRRFTSRNEAWEHLADDQRPRERRGRRRSKGSNLAKGESKDKQNHASARKATKEWRWRRPPKRTLVITGLNLPDGSGIADKRGKTVGWDFLRELGDFPHVIVVTTEDDREKNFSGLGRDGADFITKALGWEQDLRERVRAVLRACQPRELSIVVPTYSCSILVGRVWVDLPPLPFALIDAMAHRFPGNLEQFLDAVPRRCAEEGIRGAERGGRAQSVTWDGTGSLTLEQIQWLMCLREFRPLPKGFARRGFEEVFRRAKMAFERAVQTAFKEQGLTIHAERFFRRGTDGKSKTYRLDVKRTAVCDRVAEFRKLLDARQGPFRVLVVEDNDYWAAQICGALEEDLPEPRRFYVAGCYEEAIRQAREFQPHLVTLDLEIPRQGKTALENGLALWGALLEESSFSEPDEIRRVVVLSGHDLEFLERQFLRPTSAQGRASVGGPRGVLPRLARRVDARDLIAKSHEGNALNRLRIAASHVHREWKSGGVLPYPGLGPPHTIRIDSDTGKCSIDGRELEVNRRSTPTNRRRDAELWRILGRHANVSVSQHVIFDGWASLEVKEDVPAKKRGERRKTTTRQVVASLQALRDAVQRLRAAMQKAGMDRDEAAATLQELTGGYRLVGNVILES